MRMEFQKAIALGMDIEPIYRSLKNNTEREYKEHCKRIDQDYKSAQLILSGLKEEPSSQVYKLSKAYKDTYIKRHVPKEEKTIEDNSIARLLELESAKLEEELQITEITREKYNERGETENEN